MHPISFKRHRFPPDVIRYAVWLYFMFTLSIGPSRNCWPRIARRCACSVFRAATDLAACARSTAPKTPTWSSDHGSGSSKGSNPRARPRDSFPATLRSTTPSIFSPTSSADPPFANSARRPIGRGRWRPRLPDVGLSGGLLQPALVIVSKPKPEVRRVHGRSLSSMAEQPMGERKRFVARRASRAFRPSPRLEILCAL